MVEGARLESVYRGNSIEGSNPSLSAIPLITRELSVSMPLSTASTALGRDLYSLFANRECKMEPWR